jgi:DNA-binding HxlR family transcriptional regulator
MKSQANHISNCGVERTLRIIGSKWTILLLHLLFEGRSRFGEFQREMKGVSPKTLSLRLRELEKEGIIKRKVFAEVPLHIEYSLTKKGESLQEILQKMGEWGEKEVEN